jgi:hypothetical protein
MNKTFRKLAFASALLIAPAMLMAQGGPPQGGGNGGGGQRGAGGFGGGRGRGGFVPTGPAGPLAGRVDIYSTGDKASSPFVGRPTPAGEHYYIIGSVDQSQQQILLKQPTEITILLKVSPDTQFVSGAKKPLKLSDFRAGDTVWVTYTGTGADATAKHVRAGGMSVPDLHKYFLDYAEIK